MKRRTVYSTQCKEKKTTYYMTDMKTLKIETLFYPVSYVVCGAIFGLPHEIPSKSTFIIHENEILS